MIITILYTKYQVYGVFIMALDDISKFKVNTLIRNSDLTSLTYHPMMECHGKMRFSHNDYLSYLSLVLHDKLKDTNNNCYKMVIKIFSLINHTIAWCVSNKLVINDDIIKSLKEVIDLFDKYCEEMDIVKDENSIIIKHFDVLIGDYYTGVADIELREMISDCGSLEDVKILEKEKEESVEKEEFERKLKEIKGLEHEIKKLQTSLDSEVNKHSKTKSNLNELKGKCSALSAKVKELEKKVKELTKEIKQKDSKLFTAINSKDKMYEQYSKVKSELDEILVKYSESESKLKSLLVKVEDLESKVKVYEAREEVVNKDKLIDNTLFDIFCSKNSYSLEELVVELKHRGIFVDSDKVYERLMVLKNRLSIIGNTKQFPVVYSLKKPDVLVDQSMIINVPDGTKCMDILLVSDFHLTTMNSSLVSEYDKIVDYCAKNNIKLVLNAGDLFSSRMNNDSIVKRYDHFMKVIDSVYKNFPKDKDIYHAILGGNHDRNILNFGIDPISRITDLREDFINLGYDRASIIIGDDKFMIHHPHINVDSLSKLEGRTLFEYMDKYYDSLGLSQDDTYLDILGHIHMSSFNGVKGYVSVPSYLRDRRENGAWHLKVYFDEKKNINYIVLIPLVLGNKLNQVTELTYQQLKLK